MSTHDTASPGADQGNLTHDPLTNNPPADPPKTPVMPAAPTIESVVTALTAENSKFLKSAEAWITSVDRAPKVIETQAQADAVGKTLSELAKARTNAEAIHKAAKAPWYKITTAIDAIFLAGVSKRAAAGEAKLLPVQKVWLRKVEDDARKAQEAEANRLAEEAAKLKEAEDAKMREAERLMDQGDMDAAQEVMADAAQINEQSAEAAQGAEAAFGKADGKTADLVRNFSAHGVTTSAKTFTNVELLPRTGLKPEELAQFWAVLVPYIGDDVLLKAAKAAVRAGLKQCPGLRVFEDFTPTNRG